MDSFASMQSMVAFTDLSRAAFVVCNWSNVSSTLTPRDGGHQAVAVMSCIRQNARSCAVYSP